MTRRNAMPPAKIRASRVAKKLLKKSFIVTPEKLSRIA
jgi:hypothetical protein